MTLLTREGLDAVLNGALDEDGIAPAGLARGSALLPAAGASRRRIDLTSDSVIAANAMSRARLVAKASGSLSGGAIFARVLELCDPNVEVEILIGDGERLTPGIEVLRARGKARALLFAERTALNFIQRLSGVASLTARYVELCAGRSRVLDTRKTTPNLRMLEKYAVRCGGGDNHRLGLFDEAMVKNNHADLAGMSLIELLRRLRADLGPDTVITSEARDLGEAFAGVDGDADVVLLDNFEPGALASAVTALRQRAGGRRRRLELEASGGITEQSVAQVAATGVDRISIGALTHSAPALDFSFYLRPD